MRFVLFPYKAASGSAKKLAMYLSNADKNATIVVGDTDYRPRRTDIIVGWGAGEWPNWKRSAFAAGAVWLNTSEDICNSVYKDRTFNILRQAGIPIPETTYSSTTAREWLLRGDVVIARNILSGKDGEGITVVHDSRNLPEEHLYSRYFPVSQEYRVHVFRGVPFWCQVRHPIEDRTNKFYRSTPNPYVRTSSNGWTLYVSNQDCPAICKRVAVQAVGAVGLDFAAVDIGYNSRGEVCVYETNTSPELTNRTCDAYVNTLIEFEHSLFGGRNG